MEEYLIQYPEFFGVSYSKFNELFKNYMSPLLDPCNDYNTQFKKPTLLLPSDTSDIIVTKLQNKTTWIDVVKCTMEYKEKLYNGNINDQIYYYTLPQNVLDNIKKNPDNYTFDNSPQILLMDHQELIYTIFYNYIIKKNLTPVLYKSNISLNFFFITYPIYDNFMVIYPDESYPDYISIYNKYFKNHITDVTKELTLKYGHSTKTTLLLPNTITHELLDRIKNTVNQSYINIKIVPIEEYVHIPYNTAGDNIVYSISPAVLNDLTADPNININFNNDTLFNTIESDTIHQLIYNIVIDIYNFNPIIWKKI